MLILDSTSDKIQVIHTPTGTLDVHASYVDRDPTFSGATELAPLYTAGSQVAALTTAATTDIVTAPGASIQRTVKTINIRNKHASTAETVTVQHVTGAGTFELFKCSLSAGEELVCREGVWFVYDSTGAVKAGTGPGRFLGLTVIQTGTTTFTTGPATTSIKVRALAGGGAGGGAATVASGGGAGGGGASGGYAEKVFAVTPSTAYTVAVGAGGTVGTAGANPGNAGGNTTFAVGATTVTCNGGLGGTGMASGTTILSALGGAAPAVSTNADLNGSGTPGNPGYRLTGLIGNSGSGGESPFGGAASGRITQGTGGTAVGFGSGGAGGLTLNAGAATTGGAGAPGVIVVEEYS